MARISQEQTQERHTFLLDLFRSQPEFSRQEAMDAFKEKFGATINLKTLNQLRDEARKDADEAEETRADEPSHDEDSEESNDDAASRLKAAADTSAQPAPKAKPAKVARQKNVFVDAPREHLDFLQRIIGQLQEAGATNVRIDHSTDRWMVIVVDAK
jgi:hypothetical protein